ncbi:MAG: hypothetical protein D3923_16985, partial [Candidatus Electrothrix sp. AR3]|nr:hypothetical protein [Candidatus Electrothrix sp. AR3]
ALLQYQPKDKITFHLMDKYTRNQDTFNIIDATLENNRVYDSNILGAGIDWQVSDRLTAKLDYNNHFLTYEDEINNFMDRVDNGFNWFLFYEYSPKTNFFIEYQFLLVSYDEELVANNGNNNLFVGINWQPTVKTALMIKSGYQLINYDYEKENYEDPEELDELAEGNDATMNLEAQGIWQMTQRSNLLLNSKYSIEETDSQRALNKAVFIARLGFDYRFTNRLRANIDFIYENSDYAQYDHVSRVDDRYYFKPGLGFALNKRLSAKVYYLFDEKDSTLDELDYDSNTLGIGLRGSF